MQVGDLVKHIGNGSYGTVVEVRKTKDDYPAMATVYYYIEGYSMLAPSGRLEVINEK